MASPVVVVAVVAHAPLGSALKSVAEHVYGEHIQLTAIDVLPGACVDDSTDSLLARVISLDEGAGVMLMTDLPGASPANICVRACQRAREQGVACDVVAGVNASMVLRILNRRATASMAEMVQSAIEGASQTVVHIE